MQQGTNFFTYGSQKKVIILCRGSTTKYACIKYKLTRTPVNIEKILKHNKARKLHETIFTAGLLFILHLHWLQYLPIQPSAFLLQQYPLTFFSVGPISMKFLELEAVECANVLKTGQPGIGTGQVDLFNPHQF